MTVVEREPLAASVRPEKARPGTFHLSLRDDFLASLTDEEVEAAIAHELGHVWIYTHHPYLQTEQLANRIAMRVVPADSLERLYRRLWGEGALTVSLADFLGLPGGADEPTPR